MGRTIRGLLCSVGILLGCSSSAVASSPTELTETDAGVITLDIGSADAGTQGTLALAHDDARRIDHLARALKLERGKDLAGALVEARRAHYDRPGREALEATARVAGKLHDRATEGVALRELANLSPKDAGPLTRLARLHADSSDLAQAAQVAGEAAERDPTSVEAWHLKGLAELRRGALPQAIAAFETTVRLNPRHSWALNNLGYALLLSGTEKASDLSFKLVKKVFWNDSEVPMIPWTHVTGPALAAFTPARAENRITVECRGDRITILLNGAQMTAIEDPSFTDGYVGMGQFGYGRTLFHDLRVEGLP